MAKETIYLVDGDSLTAMTPSAPKNEDSMQALVARYPELISDGDGDLLLIRREQPIGDSADSGGRWSLDHLFVTRSGVPVLVELKRASDTRLRREVVRQMLDYAANATAYWNPGRLAEAFSKTAEEAGQEADVVLSGVLVGATPSVDFWGTVDANFKAGSIKLVFVADTIPRELARIIEFMNEQMEADVRGVELRWFESPSNGLLTLTPRIIGETERAQANKSNGRSALPPITPDQWIAAKLEPFRPSAAAGGREFIKMIAALGGECSVPQTQGSVYGAFRRHGSKSLYPTFLVRTAGGQVQLALGYLANWEAFQPEEERQKLVDRLTAIVGPLTKRPLNGFPAFPVTVLNSADKLQQYRLFIEEIVQRSGA